MDDKSLEQQPAEEVATKLDEEGKKRLSECKTDEEVLAVLNEAGIDLTDDVLEQVAGGSLYGIAVRTPKDKRWRPKGPIGSEN
jgi:hypothetical protein